MDVLDVTLATKLIRLKSIKAVLSKFYNNGWIKERFWSNIQIKIDKEVKKGAKESDIDRMLQLIDQTTFIGFRDACAIKLMYKSGIRICTLGELRERHIDFENMCLNLNGSILKNHKFLKLPIDMEVIEMLKILIELNKGIRTHFGTDNRNVFITQNELIKPKNKINQKISNLTNITNKMVEHCVDEETALRRFYEFIGDEEYVLVGHNARDFDLNFINVRSRMYKLNEKLNDFALIDTMYLSMYVEEKVLAKQRKRKTYSLKSMLKKYGIEIENHHRAVFDGLHTFKLFQKLLEDMEAHNKDLVGCNEPLKNQLDMRFPQMVTHYALNREGLTFINQLSSKVDTDTKNKVLSWDDINAEGHRENILVVSNGFYCKDIFESLLNGKFDERVLDNYDVIGFNSPYSNHHYEDVPAETLKRLIKIVDGICQNKIKQLSVWARCYAFISTKKNV